VIDYNGHISGGAVEGLQYEILATIINNASLLNKKIYYRIG
jgi:hypothetical protein